MDYARPKGDVVINVQCFDAHVGEAAVYECARPKGDVVDKSVNVDRARPESDVGMNSRWSRFDDKAPSGVTCPGVHVDKVLVYECARPKGDVVDKIAKVDYARPKGDAVRNFQAAMWDWHVIESFVQRQRIYDMVCALVATW